MMCSALAVQRPGHRQLHLGGITGSSPSAHLVVDCYRGCQLTPLEYRVAGIASRYAALTVLVVQMAFVVAPA